MRDTILQKFLLNTSSDSKDKLALQSKHPDSVSLDVGRDDAQERKQLSLKHGAFLGYQIQSHHQRRQSEQVRSLHEGQLLQAQWQSFNQERNEQERQKKIQDQ